MCVPAEAGYEQNRNYEITASLAFEPISPRARVLQKLEEKNQSLAFRRASATSNVDENVCAEGRCRGILAVTRRVA